MACLLDTVTMLFKQLDVPLMALSRGVMKITSQDNVKNVLKPALDQIHGGEREL